MSPLIFYVTEKRIKFDGSNVSPYSSFLGFQMFKDCRNKVYLTSVTLCRLVYLRTWPSPSSSPSQTCPSLTTPSCSSTWKTLRASQSPAEREIKRQRNRKMRGVNGRRRSPDRLHGERSEPIKIRPRRKQEWWIINHNVIGTVPPGNTGDECNPSASSILRQSARLFILQACLQLERTHTQRQTHGHWDTHTQSQQYKHMWKWLWEQVCAERNQLIYAPGYLPVHRVIRVK